MTYDASAGANRKVLLDDLPGGGSGGAPVDAQYLTLAVNGTLTDERVLTAGSGISLNDAGAGSTATLSVNINGLAPDSTPDGASDYVMTYDASAGTNKKVLLDNLPSSGGGGTGDIHAWLRWTQSGATVTVIESKGIAPSGFNRTAAGTFTLSLATPVPNAHYTIVATAKDGVGNTMTYTAETGSGFNLYTKSTSSGAPVDGSGGSIIVIA